MVKIELDKDQANVLINFIRIVKNIPQPSINDDKQVMITCLFFINKIEEALKLSVEQDQPKPTTKVK